MRSQEHRASVDGALLSRREEHMLVYFSFRATDAAWDGHDLVWLDRDLDGPGHEKQHDTVSVRACAGHDLFLLSRRHVTLENPPCEARRADREDAQLVADGEILHGGVAVVSDREEEAWMRGGRVAHIEVARLPCTAALEALLSVEQRFLRCLLQVQEWE